MKIKTISRTEEDFSRKTTNDIVKVHFNRDPALHPFEKAREYTKAIVATKLEKIFAKPFIGPAVMAGSSFHMPFVIYPSNYLQPFFWQAPWRVIETAYTVLALSVTKTSLSSPAHATARSRCGTLVGR